MADVLDRVLDLVQQVLPELTPERRPIVEVHLRGQLGGCEFGYMAKRPALARGVRMGQALQQGISISQAVQAETCHRATAYRILAKPLKRPR
jgi:hypothetical protein